MDKMIPDGYGPIPHVLTRRVSNKNLTLDKFLVGTVSTHSGNSWVTDSAAAATAYATGKKTYNAAIGMDLSRKPVANIFEAAKLKGGSSSVYENN